ncbi:MAG TPA: hydrogenase [Candidatus Binatia bacterium]|nr:hydrogenase [Candidatus Binatia bacterium]
MHDASDTVLIGIVLTGFVLVGASRLGTCVRLVALQGILLGGLTLLTGAGDPSLRAPLLALASVGLKGLAFPWLLSRAVRDADVRREVEPFVAYRTSIVVATLALVAALWLGARLPRPDAGSPSLVVPVAFFTILIGLFLIVSRKQALTQVLGYLVLENGIYVFGVGMVEGTPLVVELGVLLDLLVAVFVMGIAVFHISREFDHIETHRLTTLSDWNR